MATKQRMSFQQQTLLQQQSHHQQQRRPPDVEEALSSMLWTPYERASTTDTSSDDEDEEQLKCQLKNPKVNMITRVCPQIYHPNTTAATNITADTLFTEAIGPVTHTPDIDKYCCIHNNDDTGCNTSSRCGSNKSNIARKRILYCRRFM
ncbi:hypothetical protein EVAR_72922_1 [Eumeta japonica]|uniref:Uncharacterized protein n=1 Tax=Eumeta variegata TaxID=151549 RepID=A0A4C1SZP0_EUMVA|nr:hypothetical protein EVAR_72922_1 [Eumeta japonica]